MSKESFREILDKFKAMDDIAEEDFNPAILVGDLKDKVDAIKWRIDKWESEADTLQTEWIDPILAKKKAILKKVESIKEYCRFYMKQHEFDKLPGNAFEMRMQKIAPKVAVTVEADANLSLTYPALVKRCTTYAWDKAALRDHLKEAENGEGERFIYASLQENTCLRFYTKKGE